jgi:outer membrane lipoprotein-sorting protein
MTTEQGATPELAGASPQAAARNPRWRWMVPAGVVAVIAAVVGLRPVMADASPTLPPRTAAQLLASLPAAATHPFSGTVTITARLGLPDLPSSVQGQHAPMSAMSLLSGTHTLRLWYAGPDRQRVALVNQLAEADLIHDGQDVWAWNSDTHQGVHLRLPEHDGSHPGADPSMGLASPLPQDLLRSLTPQRLAQQLLAAVEPTTSVTVEGTTSVAGRDAYELVVAPKDDRSLVREIRLAVDARTSLPLRLEVLSTRQSDPAVESGFTSISYGTPSDDVFRAPSGQMKELTAPDRAGDEAQGDDARPSTPAPSRPADPSDGRLPRLHGSGWTAVLELPRLPDPDALTGDTSGLQPRPQGKGDTDGGGSQPAMPAPADGAEPAGPAGPDTSGDTDVASRHGPGQGPQLLQALLRSAAPVSGSFGSGRVLSTALVTVLLLDDGRVFVGAVTPATLEQAATDASRS